MDIGLLPAKPKEVDVLCVGHASYDLVFSVPHHPDSDEKMLADAFIGCGGGPAANAAVLVSKLGLSSAFAGYLGSDLYGDKHLQELVDYNVIVNCVVRGSVPTPLSTVLVKPDGKRALINYKGDTKQLPEAAVNFVPIKPKVILLDGHEPMISVPLAKAAKAQGIPTILDAGSVHDGTLALMELVDYLVCSEKFAQQYAGDVKKALSVMAGLSANVVITLGEKGLIWQRGNQQGSLPAYVVSVVDTTGAGDAFHGAFAAALALDMDWLDSLRYASAAGALCCGKAGARLGLPTKQAHWDLFKTGLDDLKPAEYLS
ncbi:MAG: PfkB family carbohydrate kinase [Methyloglobulus sp.]|nr:carbohydrate kinase [Methyloglobulus sp.]